jgi:hypothetical protein
MGGNTMSAFSERAHRSLLGGVVLMGGLALFLGCQVTVTDSGGTGSSGPVGDSTDPDTVEFTPGSAGSASTVTYQGTAYTIDTNAAGLTEVRTADGTSFSADASGNITRMATADGATFDVSHNADGSITVTPFIPELDGVGGTPVSKAIANNAASSSTICDDITEICEGSDFLVLLLLVAQEQMVDRYVNGTPGQYWTRDEIRRMIEAHFSPIIEEIQNFCAGWQLLTLVYSNADLCDGSPEGASEEGTDADNVPDDEPADGETDTGAFEPDPLGFRVYRVSQINQLEVLQEGSENEDVPLCGFSGGGVDCTVMAVLEPVTEPFSTAEDAVRSLCLRISNPSIPPLVVSAAGDFDGTFTWLSWAVYNIVLTCAD